MRQPIQHDSQHTFADQFLEGDLRDIEVLIGRNRFGRKMTEALINYAQLRVDVEKEYARALARLAEFEFPQQEPIMKKALKGVGGFEKGAGCSAVHLESALLKMQQATQTYAQAQSAFAKNVESKVLHVFQRQYKDLVGTKMKYKARLFKAVEKYDKESTKMQGATKTLGKLEAEVSSLAAAGEDERARSVRLSLPSGHV